MYEMDWHFENNFKIQCSLFKNSAIGKNCCFVISKSKKIRMKKKQNVKIDLSKKEYDINYQIFSIIEFIKKIIR